MFWATMCPSSGEPTVSMRHWYFSHCMGGCLVCRPDSHLFIHLADCLTIGPKPLPNRALHIVRSRASSFSCEYPVLSLRSSNSSLRPLPRLPVTSIPPFIFPSITCCRRQFLHKMWPIKLAFLVLISCRIFLCARMTSKFVKHSTFLLRNEGVLLRYKESRA